MPLIPSFALRPGDVPAPDADWNDIYRFTTTSRGNGAYAFHTDESLAVQRRYVADGPDGLSLDDLRGLLHITQRAHYHQGGSWPGQTDTLMERMRALVAEIGDRIRRDGTPRLTALKADLARIETDAVVNPSDASLLGGGGAAQALHAAAGPELLAACRALPEASPGVRCGIGETRVTPGFGLPARWVVHTVGPRWRGGEHGEAEALAATYRRGLAAAFALGCETLAAPAVSTGALGMPPERAAAVAVTAVRAWHAHTALPRVVLVGHDVPATATLDAAVDAAQLA